MLFGQSSETAETAPASHQKRRGKEPCQFCDCIPAATHGVLRRDHMQFPQAVLELQIRMQRGQQFKSNRDRQHFLLAIEKEKPGDEGLTNFALAIVDRHVQTVMSRPRVGRRRARRRNSGLCARSDDRFSSSARVSSCAAILSEGWWGCQQIPPLIDGPTILLQSAISDRGSRVKRRR